MSTVSGRFWRFALVTLLGILVAAVAIAALYRHVAVENFKEMRAQQNVELALALSNSLVDDVRELRDLSGRLSWTELQASPEISRLGSLIDSELAHLPVYEVNIFAPDGLVLYSTYRQRIGAKIVLNEGLDMAAAGEQATAMVRRNTFNQYDRMIEEHDMIETYLPLRDTSGQIIGVFEIHSDISGFFERLASTQRTIVIGVGSALLILYLLLVLSFWASDRRLFMGMSLPERRQRKAGADTIDRAKSDFVATISHEVRTPLNAVLGMTDLLKLTSLTRKQREYIHTIQSSGDMLISLVDNLLDFAQMESSDVDLEESDFDVIDLLERVLRIMGHSASSKGLELIVDVRHDFDLRVTADKRRLRQILVNIISNGVKFTEAGEIVVLSDAVEVADGEFNLHIEVTDTGPGIDDEDRERLFAAFASGARPDSDQPYGPGLGLTICKQLLDIMGGSIDIRSRSTGGTRVSIDVPVTRVSPSSAVDLASTETDPPVRVLSLHSNRATAASFCRLLRKWGMQCDHVFEAEEGFHMLRAAASIGNPFDCVIVDSAMTPADRLLTVRRIRNSDGIAETPVILLTSISEPLAVGEISVLGNVRCINKPVLPLDLRYNLLQSVRADPTSISPAPVPGEAADESRETRILIAEDNPVSSGLLQSLLLTEGLGADVVDNGPAVLDALRVRRYDLLLLDCQMPGMDGNVVTDKIRNAPERMFGKPVIVAITADTTERHRAQCIAAGMDDFMPKPVRLDGLRSGLRRWNTLLSERAAEDRQGGRNDLRRSIAQRAGQDDESFISGYIDLFLSDTEMRLSAMSQAFGRGDAKTVRREGHALKGSCLELGADRMARFCDDLSAATKHGNLDEVRVVIDRLGREFSRLRPVYESAQVSTTSPS